MVPSTALKDLQTVLRRALNTLDPEKITPWVLALSDTVDNLVESARHEG